MKRKNSFLTYIALVLTLSVLIVIFAEGAVDDLLRGVVHGTGTAQYHVLAPGDSGNVLALGRQDGQYVLTLGNEDGKKLWSKKLDSGDFPDKFLVDKIVSVDEDTAMLSLYQIGAEGIPETLQLYIVEDRGSKSNVLLSITCTGDTETERMHSVQFSAFALYDGVVNFFLWKSGQMDQYAFDIASSVLSKSGTFLCDNYTTAMVLRDGTIAVGQKNGVLAIYSSYGERITRNKLTGTVSDFFPGEGETFYYLDAATGMIHELIPTTDGYKIFKQTPIDPTYPLTVQSNGSLIWIEDGLLYRYDNIAVQLPNFLYRSRIVSILLTVAGIVGILFVAVLLSGLFYGIGTRKSSLMAREVFSSVMVFLIVAGVGKIGITESVTAWEEEHITWAVSSNARTIIEMVADSTQRDVSELFTTLTYFDEDSLRCKDATLYRFTEGGYEVVATFAPGLESGVVCKGNRELLQSQSHESSAWLIDGIDGRECVAIASSGGYILLTHTMVEELVSTVSEKTNEIEIFIVIAGALCALMTIMTVKNMWSGIRRIVEGMRMIGKGDFDVEIHNHSGDELEEVAQAFNHMAEGLRENSSKMQGLNEGYMRFVPKATLELLGVESLEHVTSATVVERRMVLMSVHFKIPSRDETTEQLFLAINEVIAKTNFATLAYGGNNFNYTHNGYTVVFQEEFMEDSIRAAIAIQKAIQGINQDRAEMGYKPVQMYVAIDCGIVQLGIVGDELHMVPAAISKCLEIGEQLLRVCTKLDAGILCGESVLEGLNEKNNRYVGKCRLGDLIYRVYEVTDGASFLTARGKAETRELFDRAVLNFHAREFGIAKREFLELAKSGGKDGAVWYYLNASDRYESGGAPDELLLDDEVG